MPKKMLQLILAFATGVVAMVLASTAFMATINADSLSVTLALLITSAVFLVFGLIVGLFWLGGSLFGGVMIAAPFLLVTTFSILLSGFGPKLLSNDLPILATALLTGVIGCYLGQRLTSKSGTAA